MLKSYRARKIEDMWLSGTSWLFVHLHLIDLVTATIVAEIMNRVRMIVERDTAVGTGEGSSVTTYAELWLVENVTVESV